MSNSKQPKVASKKSELESMLEDTGLPAHVPSRPPQPVTASTLHDPLKLGPNPSPIMEVAALIQVLKSLEHTSKLAEKHELTVCSMQGQTVITQGLNLEMDDELTELVQTKVAEKVAAVQERLESLGVSVDVESLLEIPSFVNMRQ